MTPIHHQQTVLITGATGNLGQAVAQAFEKQNTKLILVGHSHKRLVSVFGAASDRRVLIAADLTRRSETIDAIQQALASIGNIDAACHLAGGFVMGPKIHETPAEDWDRMQDINTRSLLNVAAAVVPSMITHGQGKFIAVGAHSAQKGMANMGAYVASKSSVMRIIETMSAELRDHRINVNCVLPSIIDTPENRATMPDGDPSRWVSPSDLAQVIAFLASPAANAIHGVSLPVTGLM